MAKAKQTEGTADDITFPAPLAPVVAPLVSEQMLGQRGTVSGNSFLDNIRPIATIPMPAVFRGDTPAVAAPEVLDPLALDPRFTNVVTGAAPGSFTAEMSNEDYHSLRDHISSTGMKALLRSAAHYRTYLEGRKATTTPNFGTAAHVALLEPEAFRETYLCYAGTRRGKAWESFQKDNEGKTILNQEEWDRTHGIVEAVRAFDEYPLWDTLRKVAETEKSIFWVDEETGVRCRIRIDALTPFMTFDLKTIDDARPDSVARQIAKMDYDLQAAVYSCGVKAFTGEDRPFCFIFAEDKKPHGIWLHTCGESVIRNGMIKFRRALRRFAEIQKTGAYPCYQNAISTIELPKYAMLSEANALVDAAHT